MNRRDLGRRGGPPAILWPLGVGLLALLASLVPVAGPAPWLLGPNWLLLTLCFFAVRWPWSTPPLLVFALGLLHDLLRDGPVGAELFALLAVVEATRFAAERRPPTLFVAEWLRFAAAAAAFEGIVLLLMAVTYADSAPLALVLQRLAIAIALYPVVAIALRRLSGAQVDDGRFGHLTF